MLNALLYDCEVARCIPDPKKPSDPTLEYCAGWSDFEGMGLSVVALFDFYERRHRVFFGDSGFDAFAHLVDEREHIIGFNSISFDDRVCAAAGIRVSTTYDLLCEARVAAGRTPHYVKGETHAGFSLNNLVNLNWPGLAKNGDGARAPELWQRGKTWEVIDYCMCDVWLTQLLFGLRECMVVPDSNGGVKTERLRPFPK